MSNQESQRKKEDREVAWATHAILDCKKTKNRKTGKISSEMTQSILATWQDHAKYRIVDI